MARKLEKTEATETVAAEPTSAVVRNLAQQNPVHAKLLAIKDELGAIGKDRRGQGINYSFRGIDDMYNALHPLMVKHGVMAYPQVIPGTFQREIKELSTKDGRVRLQTQVSYIIQVQFIDVETGLGCAVTVPAEGYDDSDKAAGKSVSYGMKTALAHALGIPTELLGEDDPDASRPDTSQDPEAALKRFIGQVATCSSEDDLRALYNVVPGFAKKNEQFLAALKARKAEVVGVNEVAA